MIVEHMNKMQDRSRHFLDLDEPGGAGRSFEKYRVYCLISRCFFQLPATFICVIIAIINILCISYFKSR